MRKKRYLPLLLICLLSFVFIGQAVYAEENEKVIVEYYYYSSCDGCAEGEVFEQDLRTRVSDVVGEDEFEVVLKDLSDQKLYDEFMEIVEEKQTDDFYPMAPLLKIGDNYLFGIDEIENHSRAVLMEETGAEKGDAEAAVNAMKGIDPKDSFFVYFYVPGCIDCEKTQSYFETLDKTFYIEGHESDLKIVYIDMGTIENIPLAQWFFEKYEVGQKDRKAPAVFYQGGYLQGYEDIKNGMVDVILDGSAKGWKDISYVAPQKTETEALKLSDWALLCVTGLVNGVNPCGLSVLLLLLSLLLAKKEDILKVGVCFIAAKFLTYLLFGTILSSAIGQLGALIAPVEKGLRMVVVCVAALCAIMNFRDARLAKKEEYGKMKMQLPKKLRKFNEEYMERLIDQGGKSLPVIAFVSGIVVSVGEFLCTGQLYLTSIVYATEKAGGNHGMLFAAFTFYLVCMCIPLLLITVLVSKSSGVMRISEFARKNMAVTKMMYGFVFAVFAVLFLIL